jgi:hypothetical protein
MNDTDICYECLLSIVGTRSSTYTNKWICDEPLTGCYASTSHFLKGRKIQQRGKRRLKKNAG